MCTCDLTKYSCDINCCCDEECSTEDKGAFRGKGGRYYKMHTSFLCPFLCHISLYNVAKQRSNPIGVVVVTTVGSLGGSREGA